MKKVKICTKRINYSIAGCSGSLRIGKTVHISTVVEKMRKEGMLPTEFKTINEPTEINISNWHSML